MANPSEELRMQNEPLNSNCEVRVGTDCDRVRYSREQVLFGLREMLAESCHDSAKKLSEDDNLHDWLSKHGDDFDFHFEVDVQFGVKISKDQWLEFYRFPPATTQAVWEVEVRPTLTLSRFADFLTEQVEAISFEPIAIAGTVCERAGAFRGIQAVVAQVAPREVRFAPSTSIRSLPPVVLDKVWTRLRWITQGHLQPLEWPYRRWSHRIFILGLIWLGISVAWGQLDGLFAPTLLCAIGTTLKIWGVAWKLDMAGDPLPSDIRTFRDLSEFVAVSLGGERCQTRGMSRAT